jgi:glycosyltransferase involved in cell wall biosynthesis
MINFFGVINQLGYGVFTYQLMRAYQKHVSPDIAFFPTPLFQAPVENPHVKRWVENASSFSKSNPSISIFQAEYLNQFCGTPMIGFPIFELDQFTSSEVRILQGLDHVLQASNWGKKTVENHGIKNVHVVPGGYDPDVYQRPLTVEQKLKRIEMQGVTFVHIGKLETRKSSVEILAAFINATRDSVSQANLVFHVFNPFDPTWYTKVEQILTQQGFLFDGRHFVRGKVKVLVPREPFQNEPAKLYQMADFGLWASKAEGWNLPLLECLACGVPCITTDNTAQGDFIRKGIYPSELVLKSHQTEPNRVNGKWWLIDQDELKAKIRNVISSPESYLKLGEMCYQSVKDFTWENAARKLGQVMKTIQSR